MATTDREPKAPAVSGAAASQRVGIKARYGNFINGDFVAPVRGDYFVNLTPITGQKITEIPRSTSEDVSLALDAAHAAAPAWGRTSPAERARVLNRIADR